MSNETIYTSFDLMKIFGIKKGSWHNIKNKFNLDLYSEQIVDGKQLKFVFEISVEEIAERLLGLSTGKEEILNGFAYR